MQVSLSDDLNRMKWSLGLRTDDVIPAVDRSWTPKAGSCQHHILALARCMRAFLRFHMGYHGSPKDIGRHSADSRCRECARSVLYLSLQLGIPSDSIG